MADPTTLTYYTLDTQRDGGFSGVTYADHPELRVAYTSPEQAMAAGDAVLYRVADEYRAKLKAYDPEREPDAAKRAWDDTKKAACFAETRITEALTSWIRETTRREEYLGILNITRESRHRWREVEMRTTIAKDGTTTITHALGKALPWTKWARGCEGGLYVPQQVALVVRATTLTMAADRADLAAWLAGGASNA